jgi:CHAT domain-containing protein/tetratricopeptide (TPR) repeat protein
MQRYACRILHVAVATAVVVATGGAQTATEARSVVRQARHAYEVDSSAALDQRWTRALARDSSDRLAALGLASLAGLNARFDEADRRYTSLLTPRDAVSVYAQLGLAQVQFAASAPGPADTAYGKAATAARAAKDSAALVEALLGWAVMRAHSRSAAEGAALLTGVDRLIPRGDNGLEANYQCTRVALGLLPRGTDPRPALRRGAALAKAAGERQIEGLCWFVIGTGLERFGDMAGAIAVFDTLERQVLAPGDFTDRARVRQHRAYCEQSIGDYGAALRSARMAIADGERAHSLDVIAYARMTQGTVYLGLGDITAAARASDSAATVFSQVGDVIGRLNAITTVGQVALAGDDTAAARQAFASEYQLATSIKDPNYVTDAQAWLADVAMHEERWDEAGRWLDAEHITIQHGRLQGWASTEDFDRAVLAVRSGQWRDAERRMVIASRAIDSTQHRDRYEIGAFLAEIHLALGDTTRAERELTAASDAFDQWRATLDDREARVLAFQFHSLVGGPDPGVAKVIAAVAHAGRIGPAFELTERRRARDLSDHLVQNRSFARTAAAPANVLETIQHALPDDATALFEYVTGPADAPTTLFVVTRQSARAYMLPPNDSLAANVSRLAAFVENGISTNAPADALGSALITPALADLPAGITRLVIVPDGVVHHVPFGALRVKGRYLVQTYATALAPSAAVQAWLWGRPQDHHKSATVLALGDPKFAKEKSGDAETETFRSAFDETGGLPRLRGSAAEAELVGRFGARSIVRLRDSASAWFFKHTALDKFRVIHLATHAVVDDRAATRTALALAPGSGESGFVTPTDLAALHLKADLVMLSACRTAGGRIIAGEGVRGLTAPLLAAGAHAVVASYWEIGDQQTVRLVHDFYRAMAEGHPAADALRLAEVAALDRGAPPREWAAFTISGDPMVRVPVKVPAFDWWWRLFH